MIVGINEAWYEGTFDFPCFIHCAQNSAHIGFATDSHDLAGHDAYGLSARLGRVHGDDVAQE
jgi:hypothetical protein